MLAVSGFVLVIAGNAGWAVVIGDPGIGWPFWAIAIGCALCVLGWTMTVARRQIIWMAGWLVAAAGAIWLLQGQLPHGLGSDFPAAYLYYVGIIVAASTTIVPKARRWTWLGSAVASAGGLWWTTLDVVRASYDYTWANASLGIGYALIAVALAPRPSGIAMPHPE